MTEDDTFRALRKSDLLVLDNELEYLWRYEGSYKTDRYFRMRPVICAEHGWTEDEYRIATGCI